MKNAPSAEDETEPEWWNEHQDKPTVTLWHQAVEDYMTYHGSDAKDVKFTINLVK